MRKILSVVETAYRATIEEQDDTVLWFNHAVKNAGGQVSILLVRAAVNYAVKGHSAGPLSLGSSSSLSAPQIDRDLSKLIAAGSPVYLVEEDIRERGLAEAQLIDGTQRISRESLPELFAHYDQIWHW